MRENPEEQPHKDPASRTPGIEGPFIFAGGFLAVLFCTGVFFVLRAESIDQPSPRPVVKAAETDFIIGLVIISITILSAWVLSLTYRAKTEEKRKNAEIQEFKTRMSYLLERHEKMTDSFTQPATFAHKVLLRQTKLRTPDDPLRFFCCVTVKSDGTFTFEPASRGLNLDLGWSGNLFPKLLVLTSKPESDETESALDVFSEHLVEFNGDEDDVERLLRFIRHSTGSSLRMRMLDRHGKHADLTLEGEILEALIESIELSYKFPMLRQLAENGSLN